ncbi:hypothetical protein QTO34_017274 [Cnephaeus nilssonii]|uniref:Uncharacterized protein n=1 Tax=Cnephaeus nilssonii TaxID=3371016 RepID=A0AA40I0P1_CNENI|nr:hypothetical protein QTO34_017274 [Eptesicus nilssonii]
MCDLQAREGTHRAIHSQAEMGCHLADHRGTRSHLLGWQTQGARVLDRCDCNVQELAAGEGEFWFLLRSCAPLEVDVLGSACLYVRHQDFGWCGCRNLGSVQGQSGVGDVEFLEEAALPSRWNGLLPEPRSPGSACSDMSTFLLSQMSQRNTSGLPETISDNLKTFTEGAMLNFHNSSYGVKVQSRAKSLLLGILAERKNPQGLSGDVLINEHLNLPISNVTQVMRYKMML